MAAMVDSERTDDHALDDHALALQLQLQESDSAGEMIACPACTFLNSSQRTTCDVCGTPLRGGAPSRRKRRSDASHLLNFEQVRREEVRRAHPVTKPVRPARRSASDQLRFLHDNLHFFTWPRPDDAAPRPEAAVDWAAVRCVRLLVNDTDALRCPICLFDPPTLPQMWHCGHVVCLPCAIRYGENCAADGRTCRCPFCAELAEPEGLRSVHIVLADKPQVDGPPLEFVKLPPPTAPRVVQGFAQALRTLTLTLTLTLALTLALTLTLPLPLTLTLTRPSHYR